MLGDKAFKELNDPWKFASKIIRENSVDEAVKALKESIGKPIESREFIAGLEFLKALKSLGKPELTNEIFMLVFTKDLARKICAELRPEIIVEGFLKSYGLGMAYLTLLEVLALKLGVNESLKLVKSLIKDALRKLESENLREFMRALIYGPLTMLKPPAIKEIIKVALETSEEKDLMLLKAEYLTSLARVHPPTYFIEDEGGIAAEVGLLLKEVVKGSLSLSESDSITAERIYQEVSIFLSEMNVVCKELSDWRPCEKIKEVAGDDLLLFCKVMGERILNELGSGKWMAG